MLVHAHPDDECISTGGTIARYSDEGAHVCLVTCTDGEEGEVAPVPELGEIEEIRARLGEIRRDELREACRRLGRVDLRLLGYRDSGMDGTPANADPRAFVNQDPGDPVGSIVRIIREVRPQVLLTYNEVGGYGHPDHIRAHRAAMAAVERAADPSFASGGGAPAAVAHAVAKVYYAAYPKSFLRAASELMAAAGSQDAITAADIDRLGTEDDAITTAVDVSDYVDRKFDALAAHRTQLGTTQWMFDIPEAARVWAMGTEHFVLARSALPRPEGREQDLFEGLSV